MINDNTDYKLLIDNTLNGWEPNQGRKPLILFCSNIPKLRIFFN